MQYQFAIFGIPVRQNNVGIIGFIGINTCEA